MLEILKYVLGDFWRFLGFIIIITTVLHYASEIMMRMIRVIILLIRGNKK